MRRGRQKESGTEKSESFVYQDTGHLNARPFLYFTGNLQQRFLAIHRTFKHQATSCWEQKEAKRQAEQTLSSISLHSADLTCRA